MKTTSWVRAIGIMDIAYFIWIVAETCLKFFDQSNGDYLNWLEVNMQFENPIFFVGFIFGLLVILSTPISGLLLIRLKKRGAYVSLSQFPFRALLIAPPTFFYLSKIVSNTLMGVTVLVLEIIKTILVVYWLRNTESDR